jgi:hypothetical protein
MWHHLIGPCGGLGLAHITNLYAQSPYHLSNTSVICMLSHPAMCKFVRPITLPHVSPYTQSPAQLSSVWDVSICRRATSLYGLSCVIRTVTRVKSVQCQLSPKMTKMSDMCHILVMPCQHDDFIMTSS